MGLTKQYLRYVEDGIFGIVSSKNCNSVFLKPNPRLIVTGGTNRIIIWDVRLKRKVRVLNSESPAVLLRPNHESTLLAVGHVGGGVSLYDLKDLSENASPDPNVTFEGHTSEVLCLGWDDSGTIVASGGKDTRVILWDCVSETGIAKLKGHRGPITRLRFWKESKYLVTSSTDSTLKIWDMITHDCIHTIPGNGQIWDFCLWNDYIFLAETHLRLFKLNSNPKFPDEFINEEFGTLYTSGNDRIKEIQIVDDKYLICIGAKSQDVDFYYLNSTDIAQKKLKKRLKKNPESECKLSLHDLVRKGDSERASESKLKSFDFYVQNGIIKVLCSLPSNQLEMLTFDPAKPQQSKESKSHKFKNNNKNLELLGFDGHRKIIRGISFSSDKTSILTGSADAFKIWNRSTLSCILTISHEYPVVTAKFCPGDRHFIAGTSDGHLVLGDISNGKIIQVESSGEESVWGIDIYPNNTGFVSCNGTMLQLYDFSMSDGKLRFDLQRELNVQESILCVKISPNNKFLAVGLLDSTIKVFYLDTLKFHLSMYGHKLPVVSITISSDSSLLGSVSGDKSVRVWGLDYGDCHCSMVHTDGLVGVEFLENTHHLVSAAKDSINFYDGDSHQRIQTIKAHTEGSTTCMDVIGLFVVTSGRDQTIRLFNRTDEILVLDDERETEREAELEKESRIENSELPSLQTAESEKGADKLIEALDVFKDQNEESPLLLAYGAKNIQEFMVKVLSCIKASELEQSIMLLPVSYVHGMIPALSQVLKYYPLATELAIRTLVSLCKFHLPSLRVADKEMLKTISNLAQRRIQEHKDIIGFNLAGLKFLNDKRMEEGLLEEFRELIGERKKKKKKRERAVKRAMLTLTL